MAKSRQRNSYPPIIDRPEFKSRLRHISEVAIAASLWALWLYWISPIFTVILWLLGLQFFYQKVITESRLWDLLEILHNGGLAFLVIFLMQLVWINYNYFIIFKRKGERRGKQPACNDEAMAMFFKVEPKLLKQAKEYNQIDIVVKGQEIIINPHQ
ncbi:MAG: poly-beta-1,6-N-acetyl-D-glucosamine biosynthesis protein PgaD [Candidatus Omnitrophica bacterium]|nr:poly-beta-1,6-N-acetyl-D-glucosamine biosynthesis protein PgaD [Candidatus Omnitrophota bacterium]MBU1047411.1 poly-beta-1,6-N-acetyl-D-glucosamine biosynthesis protein PgaD [Candidatus Omnitrophota bacterium]MBU1630816.1 poly-beta-1,6-N-acetyl-D-glucosamine biosynthesis protein PgaD [Candidatus Omnitrophota bacterium]MBU1888775.1 poly-beta-1,6-N-acetyl-D-glucosamine biosynthesis protein PgaD [Candidatus Omnitrophota bacterium]